MCCSGSFAVIGNQDDISKLPKDQQDQEFKDYFNKVKEEIVESEGVVEVTN